MDQAQLFICEQTLNQHRIIDNQTAEELFYHLKL